MAARELRILVSIPGTHLRVSRRHWPVFSRGPAGEPVVASDHDSILERPHVALLAEALGRALEGP